MSPCYARHTTLRRSARPQTSSLLCIIMMGYGGGDAVDQNRRSVDDQLLCQSEGVCGEEK